MKLFVGNFDFEHGLGHSSSGMLPASLRGINAELACTMATIAIEGDCVWTPAPVQAGFARDLRDNGFPAIQFVGSPHDVPKGVELCPWGWSRLIKAWGLRNGWRGNSPELSVVEKANSRDFSSRLEREWNVGLEGARSIHSIEGIGAAVSEISSNRGWVLKANFGMSARERVLGHGPPTANAMRWARKRLAEGGALYFEPWVDRMEEIGFQFSIPKLGVPILEGITPLLTDSQGVYRGSRLTDAAVEPLVQETIVRAAGLLQGIGYYGPLGIDAMKYQSSDGEIRWRPLQDINARLTMGRLALGLRRFVRPAEHATWLHVSQRGDVARITEWRRRLDASLPAGVRAVHLSPLELGGRPAGRGTILLVASADDKLYESEQAALELGDSLMQ